MMDEFLALLEEKGESLLLELINKHFETHYTSLSLHQMDDAIAARVDDTWYLIRFFLGEGVLHKIKDMGLEITPRVLFIDMYKKQLPVLFEQKASPDNRYIALHQYTPQDDETLLKILKPACTDRGLIKNGAITEMIEGSLIERGELCHACLSQLSEGESVYVTPDNTICEECWNDSLDEAGNSPWGPRESVRSFRWVRS